MPQRRETADRSVGLFLLAALLFNPPVLTLFGAGETVFGLPLSYFYIFVVWALVIWLMARIAERWRKSPPAVARAADRDDELGDGRGDSLPPANGPAG